MNFAAVTTFSPSGYEQYGKRFLESYVKFWTVPICVYYEGQRPDFNHALITWVNLDLDKDRAAFMGRHKDNTKDYRFQIVRFAHKIWALTDPKRLAEVDAETIVWLDADIETISPVDEGFLSEVCPAGFCGSYLGRVDWHHSECGFVSYNRKFGGVAFLEELREIYKTDKILEFDEHHDSFIFSKIKKNL